MCEFRDQVERRNCYLERYSPKCSCHLVEPTWVTHLLRTASRIVEVECILRAKQQRHLKVPELLSWVLNGRSAAHLLKTKKPKFDVPVCGLAGCHSQAMTAKKFKKKQTLNTRWSQQCRYARLAKSGITVDGKCLRWQETYHDAPALCENWTELIGLLRNPAVTKFLGKKLKWME